MSPTTPPPSAITGVDVVDSRSVVVHWSAAVINADVVFGVGETPNATLIHILPRHILEARYLEDRASFTELSYWSGELVGTGAFRLKELARGTYVLLEANPAYVMGRPKIDELEVRFIPDSATVVANLLAGAVEVTMGRSLSLEQGVTLRDQWRGAINRITSG